MQERKQMQAYSSRLAVLMKNEAISQPKNSLSHLGLATKAEVDTSVVYKGQLSPI